MKTFRTACDPWGITVERVEVSFLMCCENCDNDVIPGEELVSGQGDGEVHGGRGNCFQGGKWSAYHAEGGGEKSRKDKVSRRFQF